MKAPTPLYRHYNLRWLSLATLMIATAACKSEPPSPATASREAGTPGSATVALSAPLPTDPDVQVARFDNGVTFLSRVIPTNLDRVVLALVVKAGSLVEHDDERGLAHFVEHMGFRGTSHFPGGEVIRFLDRAGLAFGADANAFTGHASTSYILELPAGDGALLDRAVALLADWAAGMAFDPAVVDKERSVVLAEMRERRGTAPAQLQEMLRERWLMRGTRHAERAVMGLESVVESASAEQLAGYYRRWYQPQNLLVMANGRFDAQAMRRRVEQHFAALPAPAKPEAVPRFTLAARKAPDVKNPAVVLEANAELPASSVTVHLQRGVSAFTSEADYRRRLLDRLVAELLRQRVQALPQRAGSTLLGANVFYVPGDVGMYDTLEVSARPEGAPSSALVPLLTELERVQRHGFTARELAVASARVKQDWVKSADARGQLKAYVLSVGQRVALGEATPSLRQEADLNVRLLAGISAVEVSGHGAAWARDAERYLIVLGRDAAMLPSEGAVREIVGQVSSAPVAAVEAAEEGSPSSLMQAPPPQGSILSRQRIEALDVRVWTLSNGARVVFKPLPSEGRVGLRAISPGGIQAQRGRALVNARVADAVVFPLGLGANDGTTTARLLAEADVQIVPRVLEFSEGVRASAPARSLEALLTAVYLSMAAPHWDTGAFELQRRRVREVLRNQAADPVAFFASEVERQLFSMHPRHTPLVASDADQLDPEAIRAFYMDRFGDAGDFTFVIAGNTTDAALEPLVERYLGSLPGTPRADGAPVSDIHARPGVTRVRVRRGVGHPSQVRRIYHGEEPTSPGAWGDLEGLRAYLDLRLREVLRQELGAVYHVETWSSLREPPQQGYELGFRFDCPDRRSAELRDAALGVLADLRKNGVAQSYLDAIGQQRARAVDDSRHKTEFWLDALADAYRRGNDPARVIAERTAATRFSSDELRRAARHYLRDDQYLDALLEPEAAGTGSP